VGGEAVALAGAADEYDGVPARSALVHLVEVELAAVADGEQRLQLNEGGHRRPRLRGCA
jgi:hypothetical protein